MQARQLEAESAGAIIMAAGAGRRMGAVPKSLLRRDGEPLLLRQVRIATAAGVEAITVVLGHYADQLITALDRSLASTPDRHAGAQVSRVVNPNPGDGTGSSLRCGLAALPRGLSTYLVMLGDQPLLEAEDVQAALTAWRARPAGIELVVPRHAGRLGHPVCFGPQVYREVVHARGGGGVREWRQVHPESVLTLEVSHARCTTDVDTPADLDRLHDEFGVQLDWPET
ncbi:MAG TPA: nucleotidyltransferase family protein [Rhodanobacteraceae bacterium]|nr:nucleotidyltransferase family protein [Rhodanobacteraceae bacterium]